MDSNQKLYDSWAHHLGTFHIDSCFTPEAPFSTPHHSAKPNNGDFETYSKSYLLVLKWNQHRSQYEPHLQFRVGILW